METLTQYEKTCRRLNSSLFSTIRHFREGCDRQGMDSFLNYLDDLEIMLEICRYSAMKLHKIDELVSILKSVQSCVINQDIAGLTDILEFSLHPLVEGWLEEAGI